MPEAPRIKRIQDIPAIPAGGVGYRLVRRELGIEAFGVNAFTADAGDQLIEEHDETGAGAGRHEELYVVITGPRASRSTASSTTRRRARSCSSPIPRRAAGTAVEDGTTVIVVGGRAGEPYEVSPWESSFAAGLVTPATEAPVAEMMNTALPSTRTTRTCTTTPRATWRSPATARTRSGTSDGALVDRARVREWVIGDPDFDYIRDDPEFPASYPLASLSTTRTDITPNSPAAHSSTASRMPRIFSGSGRKRRLMIISRIE